jgi:threo-3-hydroxy-L-aspartate ammonia-lyase
MTDAHPSLDDVLAARRSIGTDAHYTPILTSRFFNSQTGTLSYFKAENFQRIGAFKIRGALNKIKSLSPENKKRGVITFSSGNHAQATALAARLANIPCVVVMPENALSFKRQATKAYGAKIEFAGTTSEDRMNRAYELQKEHGYTMIPPYDDPLIIAGQGTCALEILEQVPDLTHVLVPVGGGGLLSGCALAIKSIRRDITVIGVETEGADDANKSFREKRIVKYEHTDTIADGMRNLCLGTLNFTVIMRYVDDMLTVSDNDVRVMMRFFFERMKIVVEPTGAVAPAAIRRHSGLFTGKRVCAIVSGGNVGPELFHEILSENTQK